jgi:hypothetical protein
LQHLLWYAKHDHREAGEPPPPRPEQIVNPKQALTR